MCWILQHLIISVLPSPLRKISAKLII